MVHSGVLLEQDSHDPELALHELASTEAYGAKKQFLDRVTEISSEAEDFESEVLAEAIEHTNRTRINEILS
ncbi:MAG: hypothetical protein ALECFALPRED_000708 [Alectoria fallacina]|uniref:Uncharacterized protein n=1 Tax=Alectoria fallacina TaxID=1903189 RepID=A0A8H3JAT4_9LECA|nr:MAG: hypothetical protein ALECFALPRED_000708 [Alectoria fallacina]